MKSNLPVLALRTKDKLANFIDNVYQRLFYWLFDHNLPPSSEREKTLIDDLKRIFSDIHIMEVESMPASEARWNENLILLRNQILTDGVRNFLRWEVIRNTMFVNRGKYIREEYSFLRKLEAWGHRWEKALREDVTGHPIPSLHNSRSSDNLIHHAYHVAIFEETTRFDVSRFNAIFEFGGGYGSMCRLIFRLGFRGRYLIFDLPAFSAIQRYFLKTLDFPVCESIKEFLVSEAGILCVSDYDELEDLLQDDKINDFFIATWSISETPCSLRDKVLPLLSSFKAYLLGYQSNFGEMDNNLYFSKWMSNMKNIEWINVPIRHLPGNYYLIGRQPHQSNLKTRNEKATPNEY